ncbi:DUF2474 domain-containing protein [Comamonas sp. SCN 65-56]|nr:DUF2474 domain-containing protein [Comamonas sp. SCN 65-56]
MEKPVSPSYGWSRRLLWLGAIWACSIAVLGAAALVMRLLMQAAGMTR